MATEELDLVVSGPPARRSWEAGGRGAPRQDGWTGPNKRAQGKCPRAEDPHRGDLSCWPGPRCDHASSPDQVLRPALQTYPDPSWAPDRSLLATASRSKQRSGRPTAVQQGGRAHLAAVVLVRKLDVHVVLQADLGDHCALPSDDLGMVFGVYSDAQLKTPQSLERDQAGVRQRPCAAQPLTPAMAASDPGSRRTGHLCLSPATFHHQLRVRARDAGHSE